MITAIRSNSPRELKSDITNYSRGKDISGLTMSDMSDIVLSICVVCPTIIKKRCTPAFGKDIKKDLESGIFNRMGIELRTRLRSDVLDHAINFIVEYAPLRYMKEPLKMAKKEAFEWLDDRASRNWVGIKKSGGFDKAINAIFGFLGI
jgi:hypothetical protein